MAFTRNKPAAADLLSTSQGIIKDNFNSSDDTFGVDHYPFSDITSKIGAHKQVQLSETTLGAIPVSLRGVGYETLYASTTGAGGQLFYVQGNNATGVQLTGPGTPSALVNGYTFLAGGLLLQWGKVTAVGTSTHVFNNTTFNIAFPNACFMVNTTPVPINTGVTDGCTIGVRTFITTQFAWVYNKSTGSNYVDFYWMAIGN